MSARDFAILLLICIVWALNTIVSKLVVTQMGVPPLFYATLRTLVIAAAVLPWLLPMPRPRLHLLAAALLMGGGAFGLVFVGLRTATPSSVAVVIQLGVPMTTLLSVVMLGERIRWRRGLGIALTFAGALLVMWDPNGLELANGLLFVAASALASSLGAVMLKQMHGLRPLQFQAWVGMVAILPLGLLSALLETDQGARALQAGWSFAAAVAFSALVVSVLGHTAYYRLVQAYEANLIAPLTLISPLMTIGFGIVLLHDPFDLRTACGAAIALLGVLVILLRRNRALPAMLVLRERT